MSCTVRLKEKFYFSLFQVLYFKNETEVAHLTHVYSNIFLLPGFRSAGAHSLFRKVIKEKDSVGKTYFYFSLNFKEFVKDVCLIVFVDVVLICFEVVIVNIFPLKISFFEAMDAIFT